MNSSNIPQRRIFINGRFLTQQTSGVQAFARSVCAELLEVIPEITILAPKDSDITSDDFKEHILETGSLKGHLWEQISLPAFMKNYPEAMLLNLCNTGPVKFNNQVATIHDLAFIKNPSWFHPAFSYWYRFMVPRLLKNSKKVITVSETIKQEIIAGRFANESKIIVIGNKVATELIHANEKIPTGMPVNSKRFFLMVGSADPRKNFKFIESYFAKNLSEYNLVIAGGAGKNFRKEEHPATDNIIRLGYTGIGELKWLYRNAIAFVNPSLYEGFGIPNIEAMAFNCPLICTDIPVFREICGDAAIYFEPGNATSLSNCISQVLENKKLTESKTLEGKGIFTQIQNQNRTSKIIKALFE